MNFEQLIQAIFTSVIKHTEQLTFNVKSSLIERPDLEYCDIAYIDNRYLNVVYKFNDDFDYQEMTYDVVDNITDSDMTNMLLKLKQDVINSKTDLQIQQENQP